MFSGRCSQRGHQESPTSFEAAALGRWGARVLLALGGCSRGNLRGEGEMARALSPKSLPKGLLAEGQVWNAQQLVLGPQSPGGLAVVSPLGVSPSGPLA